MFAKHRTTGYNGYAVRFFFPFSFHTCFPVGSTKEYNPTLKTKGVAKTEKLRRLLVNLSLPFSVGHTLSIGAMESLF